MHIPKLARTTVIAACLLPTWGAPARAADDMLQSAAQVQTEAFDWLGHTATTLTDLQHKLNLKSGQQSAWDAWSRGVTADAQRQLARAQAKDWDALDDKEHLSNETTPERMARMVIQLRADTRMMNDHLAELEKAAERTRLFYGELGVDQRTIFDLFWRDIVHRAATTLPGGELRGHDQHGAMRMMLGADCDRDSE